MSKNFRNTLATASISLSLFVAAPTNVCSMACCLDKGVEMHRHFPAAVYARTLITTAHLASLIYLLAYMSFTSALEKTPAGAIMSLQTAS